MTVRIVTDSTSDITPQEANNLGIGLVPLHIIINGKDFLDNVDLKTDNFYSLLPQVQEIHTSQPNPNEILDVCRSIGKEGDEIVLITISSNLSKTYDRAIEAARENPDIMVVDSLSTSMGLRFLVLEAMDMAKDEKSAKNIVARLEELKHKLRFYAVFDTLKYLKKGGRIGKVSAFFGTLLNIKIIVSLENGELVPVDKQRTKERAKNAMLKRFLAGGEMSRMGVIHTQAREEAEEIKEILSENHADMGIPIVQFGPTLGVHAGPGLVGVCGLLK